MTAAVADEPDAPVKDQQADRQKFDLQTSRLKQGLAELNGKIKDDTTKLNGLTDPATAKKTVEELQASLSSLLAQTADNGDIAALAAKITAMQGNWVAEVRGHHFSADREAYLEGRISSIIDRTKQAVDGITKIRHELTTTLKHLQSEQDYLEELARVEQGEQMTMVLQDLLKTMSMASDRLNVIMNGVPGT